MTKACDNIYTKSEKLRYFNLISKIDYKKIRITLDYKKDLKI